jgi:flagellar biosynthesis/type III secretory pathway protein FliH
MTRVLKGQAARSAGSTRLESVAGAAAAANQAAGRARDRDLGARPTPTASAPSSPAAAGGMPEAPRPAVAAPPALPAAEAEALRRRAMEEGFESGRREAQARIDETLARQQAAWRATMASLEADAQARLRELEAFGVAVAFEACATVLGDAAVEGRAVTAVVQRLLARTRDAGLLRVQVARADVDAVERALQADAHAQHRLVRIEAHADLEPGACRLVSAHGQLESDLPAQLCAIQKTLLATHAERLRAAKTRE